MTPNKIRQSPPKYNPSRWQDGSHDLPIPDTWIAVDFETTGGDFRRPYPGFQSPSAPFMCALCDQDGREWLFEATRVNPATRHVTWSRSALREIRQIVRNQILVFHASLFDLQAAGTINLPLWSLASEVHDTLAMSHVLDSEESHALKDLAYKYLDIEDDDESDLLRAVEIARRESRKAGIPVGPGRDDDNVRTDYWLPKHLWPGSEEAELCGKYCLTDVLRTSLLCHLFTQELQRQDRWRHYCREQRQIHVALELHNNGMPVKRRSLHSLQRKCRNRMHVAETKVAKHARNWGFEKFNIRSNEIDLPALLYGPLDLTPVKLTAKARRPSVDSESLELLAADTARQRKSELRDDRLEVLQAVSEYRTYKTRLGYLDNYESRREEDGRLYGGWNPWGTVTTRYSSKSPNLQNVEKRGESHTGISLRTAFGPPPGSEWWCLDWSQLELRLMAFASGDPTLRQVLDHGADQHQITADAFDVPRWMAKNINFAWQYGAGAKKLSRMAGVDASNFSRTMAATYPGVVDFMDHTQKVARRLGYVETMFGYPLTVDKRTPYKGTNYTIQGTAGDMAKNALIEIQHYIEGCLLTDSLRLIAMVHDEVILEAVRGIRRPHLANIKAIMTSAGPAGCNTPVEASVTTTNWSAA